MRFPKKFVALAIAAVAAIWVLAAAPSFGIQSAPSQQTQSLMAIPAAGAGQSEVPVQVPILVAAKGCEGARAARSYLRSAESALRGVRRESRNLSDALSDVRSALREVEIHWEAKRC